MPDPNKRPTCEELLQSSIIVNQVTQLSKFDNNIVEAVSDFY